jgi:hypothetical protein
VVSEVPGDVQVVLGIIEKAVRSVDEGYESDTVAWLSNWCLTPKLEMVSVSAFGRTNPYRCSQYGWRQGF